MSTEEGAYKLFLPPDTYYIVATRDGYLPGCQEIEAQYFEEYIAEFSLLAVTEIITISGTVSGLTNEEAAALLSIRQTINCGSGNVTIEVASVSVANDTTSDGIALPAGIYDVVVSAEGEERLVFEDLSEDTELNISFGL